MTSQACQTAALHNQQSGKKIQCINCGHIFEKIWHIQAHKCQFSQDRYSMSKERDELKYRCAVYLEILRSIGLDISTPDLQSKIRLSNPPQITIEKVFVSSDSSLSIAPSVKSSIISVSEIDSCEIEDECTPTKESLNGLKRSVSERCLDIHISKDDKTKRSASGVELKSLSDDQDLIFKINDVLSYITKKIYVNVDGENLVYLLGNLLGLFVSKEYSRRSEFEIITVINKISAVKSMNTDHLSSFEHGVQDSFCRSNMMSYIMLGLGWFTSECTFNAEELLSITPVNTEEYDISRLLTLTFWFVPLKKFISKVLIGGNRYGYHQGMYYGYVKDNTGKLSLRPDPYLCDLTLNISNIITSECTSIFRKLYKTAYRDNDYRSEWTTHPFLSQYIQVYKNIMIASQIFDIGHILREQIKSKNVWESIPNVSILPHVDKSGEFEYISSRIAMGLPPGEMINFFDSVFDRYPEDICQQYYKKYLGDIKEYKSVYQVHPRFKQQLLQEINIHS
jgi:hypothetical protein